MPIYVGNNKIKPNGIKEAYVGSNKVYSAALPPHWETLWEGTKSANNYPSSWENNWTRRTSIQLNNLSLTNSKFRITGSINKVSQGSGTNELKYGYIKYDPDGVTSRETYVRTNDFNVECYLNANQFFLDTTELTGSNTLGRNCILNFLGYNDYYRSQANLYLQLFINPSTKELVFYSRSAGSSLASARNLYFTVTITKVEQWQE